MWRPGDYFRIGFYGGLGFFLAGLVFAFIYWLCAVVLFAAVIGAGNAAGSKPQPQAQSQRSSVNPSTAREIQEMINSGTNIADLEQAQYVVKPAGEREWDLPCKDGTLRIVTDRAGRITGTSIR